MDSPDAFFIDIIALSFPGNPGAGLFLSTFCVILPIFSNFDPAAPKIGDVFSVFPHEPAFFFGSDPLICGPGTGFGYIIVSHPPVLCLFSVFQVIVVGISAAHPSPFGCLCLTGWNNGTCQNQKNKQEVFLQPFFCRFTHISGLPALW